MDKSFAKAMAQNHADILASLDKNKPVVLFAAGGTAGHINPALSIAFELAKTEPETQIVFCGRSDAIEAELVGRAGFPFYWIEAIPFEYHSAKIFTDAVFAYFRGRRQCLELIDQLPVKAVVGTGGYVCAPLMAAGKTQRLPRLLHEQNAYPGKSTRSMSGGAACVCISFENTRSYFKSAKKVLLTGNPIAPEFFEDTRAEARERLGIIGKQRYVLATGGSLGSVTINHATSDLAARLYRNPSSTPYKIHLVTGRKHYNEVKEQLDDFGDYLRLSDYVFDMHDQLAAADLVICRAGAGTCAELAAMGKPSILVPYPHAKGDHQTKNAAALVDAGAALLVADQDLSGMELRQLLDDLFLNPSKLEAMAAAAKSLAKPEAASAIASEIVKAMGNKQS